jgi:CheY-like chemotaxis protein/anti-sigma regulatory factor (Ser/Thr protein kinase)
MDMLRPAAGARGLALSLDVSPDAPPHLVGDDARLRQVLVNLVSNAVKFTERGAVTLRITARAAAPERDHAIAFRVEDTGIGMTPDVIARLFQPFEQADGSITRRYGGTGLGLAISRQIIAAMGGDIDVASEPGRGSIFSFTLQLPATTAPPEAAALAPREDRPPLAILVVDDHPINRDVARAKLGRIGYPVDLANDGEEALSAVSRRDYDVVFMDLQMPGMSGIEATARMTEMLSGKRAPHIIAMTASVYDDDREACRRAGMRDFVGKPIDLAQLDAVLSRVAEERGAGAPRPPRSATLSGEMLSRLWQIESLGEPEFVATLARRFVSDAQKRLPRMADALGRGDAPEIAREAHILTSSSATLGATEMSDLCAWIERAAREGRIEDIGGEIDTLSRQLVEVERALEREIRGESI